LVELENLLKSAQHTKSLHFAERMGIRFEKSGLTRMAGRILGWLLLCSPPHQSSQNLGDVLQASKGAISINVRQLVQLGFIDQISLPGNRRTHYVIQEGVWNRILHAQAKEISELLSLSEEGLEILSDQPESQQTRLTEMHKLFSFFEKEFPALVQHWEQEHGEKP
jgi:DNA-binding transcriptional regulator GbsR (MarR family)